MRWESKVLFISSNRVLLLRMINSSFQASEDMVEFQKNKGIVQDKIISIINHSMIKMETNSKAQDTTQLELFMQRLKWQVIHMHLLFS